MSGLRFSIALVLLAPQLACQASPPQSADAASSGPELPTGHPPVENVVPDLPPSALHQGGLAWDAPDTWPATPPQSSFRVAQYELPGADGPGECIVYYFGPGQGGDAMANAMRWADQFRQPDGASSAERLKTEELEASGIPVLRVEIAGTYLGGMTTAGPSTREDPDHTLLGAVAQGPDANVFFKCVGPTATMEAQTPAFNALVESLRPVP